MTLLFDSQVWLSFLTLALLEIVLGIDNIIFLTVLVNRLPASQRAGARFMGLGFAMVTRIGLLFSITWIATLRTPLVAPLGHSVTGRDLILFCGGVFLVIKSTLEIRAMLSGRIGHQRKATANSFWWIIVQIGVIDLVFSLDSVFAAIGLAQRLGVMVAAIVLSVMVMMLISASIARFVDRHPSIKILALAFLALVGAALIADAGHITVPRGYLYFAAAFAAAVEWINIRFRGRLP
jgi:predicted tellurium resistance membrane protein TerC